MGVEIVKTKKALTYSVVLESLKIENIYKKNPYYAVVAYSQLKESKCFIKLVYSKSLDNPNLVYYLGFSMDLLVISLTSQEIEVCLDNFN